MGRTLTCGKGLTGTGETGGIDLRIYAACRASNCRAASGLGLKALRSG